MQVTAKIVWILVRISPVKLMLDKTVSQMSDYGTHKVVNPILFEEKYM